MHRKTPDDLLTQNKAWAAEKVKQDPAFFSANENVQKPDYLWIGCSDSRVPANEIFGLKPGEMFVHRNIANVVPRNDVNCQSVIQYAVEVLEVSHIIVTGHYGCGGVKAAMDEADHGEIDNWLVHIKDVYRKHHQEIDAIGDPGAQANRLCELNVLAQVRNVAETPIVQNAWQRGRNLTVHGWIYRLSDGILKSLNVDVNSTEQVHQVFSD